MKKTRGQKSRETIPLNKTKGVVPEEKKNSALCVILFMGSNSLKHSGVIVYFLI
jgi:hypothetical protein